MTVMATVNVIMVNVNAMQASVATIAHREVNQSNSFKNTQDFIVYLCQ